MLSNHGIGEDPSESLGLQGSSQSINPKGNQPSMHIGRADAEISIL